MENFSSSHYGLNRPKASEIKSWTKERMSRCCRASNFQLMTNTVKIKIIATRRKDLNAEEFHSHKKSDDIVDCSRRNRCLLLEFGELR